MHIKTNEKRPFFILKRGRARLRAFSLIELLVAVAVFSAMAAIAYAGLSSVVKTRAVLATQQEEFAQLIRTVTMLERDLRKAVARPIRGNYGEPQPALVGATDHLELTRMGFANPQDEPRSNLERVMYGLDNGNLRRATYPVLDRAPGTLPRFSALHADVKSLRLRYLDASKHWLDSWPPVNASRLYLMPLAVEFRLELKDYGEITRTIEMASTPPLLAADAVINDGPPGATKPPAIPGGKP